MREQKLYICDFCGTQYKNKYECEECEKHHVKVCEIVDTSYVTYKNDKTGYPQKIEVKMDDGMRVWYHR